MIPLLSLPPEICAKLLTIPPATVWKLHITPDLWEAMVTEWVWKTGRTLGNGIWLVRHDIRVGDVTFVIDDRVYLEFVGVKTIRAMAQEPAR